MCIMCISAKRARCSLALAPKIGFPDENSPASCSNACVYVNAAHIKSTRGVAFAPSRFARRFGVSFFVGVVVEWRYQRLSAHAQDDNVFR